MRKASFDEAAAIIARVGVASLVRRDWSLRLLAHPRRVDKELAAVLLRPLAGSHQADVERAIGRLAKDEDWEVRETGASLFGYALDAHFERYLPSARTWVTTGEPRLRRAVVVAAKHAARARLAERETAILDLVEGAVHQGDEYVRKSLGPFAVGDQLLRSYPEATLERLGRWARDPDENARWNAAMAFTTATGARLGERAFVILAGIAADERPFVRRAATAALRNIFRRRPELRATVLEWSGGSRPVIERALRSIQRTPAASA
ncbi:MAG: hypothetical protein NVS9B6_18580 [Candidatus Limnocylindrales bacterium]